MCVCVCVCVCVCERERELSCESPPVVWIDSCDYRNRVERKQQRVASLPSTARTGENRMTGPYPRFEPDTFCTSGVPRNFVSGGGRVNKFS